MTARVTLYAIAFVAGAIVLYHDTATHAADIPWKLDEKTAQALAALAAGDGANPGDLDPDLPTNDPPFFVFDGISPPPAEGSFGFFAVNPWTGDVWALWGCRKLSTPALRKLQAEIRQRFTREELKQYAKLRNLKPECVVVE
jgi:hypothetical protein